MMNGENICIVKCLHMRVHVCINTKSYHVFFSCMAYENHTNVHIYTYLNWQNIFEQWLYTDCITIFSYYKSYCFASIFSSYQFFSVAYGHSDCYGYKNWRKGNSADTETPLWLNPRLYGSVPPSPESRNGEKLSNSENLKYELGKRKR